MAAVVTQLLVRFANGYTLVDDLPAQAVWGVKRGFLQLGSVFEPDEATRVAEAVMAFQHDPRVATALGVEPTGNGDMPYVDFVVGDTITAPDESGGATAQRVVSLTVVEDDQGEITCAPELKASYVVAEEMFDRQLKKLLNGSLRGSSFSPTPLPTGTVTRAQNGN